MTDAPLRPFAPPAGLSIAVPAGALLDWILFAVFLFWCVYTLVAVYHWFKYSHAGAVALPAIIVHIAVSSVLLGLAVSGLVI